LETLVSTEHENGKYKDRHSTMIVLASMPSLQLGVDVVLIFV